MKDEDQNKKSMKNEDKSSFGRLGDAKDEKRENIIYWSVFSLISAGILFIVVQAIRLLVNL
jgi:hypothetical protein